MDNASNNLEDLLKLAECAICCELKTDHRILVSCGHSFCKDDIQSIIKTQDVKCPLCRKPFTVPTDGLNSLIKDFHKIALVELAIKWQNSVTDTSTSEICSECSKAATRWCQEDECLFCDTHAEEAHRFGKAKNHTLVIPSKKIVKMYCTSHKKELEKFCLGCDKVICIDCFIFDHRDHKIDNVDAIIEEKKNNLLRDWKAIEEPLQIKMLKEQQHLQEMIKKDDIKLQSLKEQGDKYFQQSFEMLKLAEQKFNQELKELKKQRENEISPKLHILDRSVAEIKMQSQTLQASLSHGNAAQWLIMESSVRKEFEKWAWNQEPEVEYQFEAQLPSLSATVNQIGIQKLLVIQPSKPKSLFGAQSAIFKEERPKCRALYAFVALSNEELTIKEGDIITIIEKNASGWWKGELNGITALFPSNYVKELLSPRQRT